VILRARVEDEVLGQAAGALVVVAEVLVEVVDDRRAAPPRDRDQKSVEQADDGDHRRRAEQRPDQPDDLIAMNDQRPAEEVRADGDEIVLEREPDRLTVGRAAEPVLRDDRVDADEDRERRRQHVGNVDAERELTRAQDSESDTRERDRQQDLLPGLEGGQSAPSNPGPVQSCHDRVVRR
jgi:hypothetical protein